MNQPVFEPSRLAGIELRNRILRSATHEGLADDRGFPTERLTKRYLQLARGRVGAIITGYAGVAQNGKSNLLDMLMIDRDEHVAAYRRVTAAVHEHETPILMQVAHCGRQTRSVCTGERPVAPSALRDRIFDEDRPRELSAREIEDIIERFVCAIERAKAAGFDGVQLHAAHGYLLASFLSPYSNRRRDEWGGALDNRYRIVDQILRRARARVGAFPILIKLNAYDGRKGGMRVGEAVSIAQRLEASGCDAIEVSCGTFEDGFFTVRGPEIPVDAVFAYLFRYRDLPAWLKALAKPVAKLTQSTVRPITGYNVQAAAAIKAAVGIPVIVVGGIRTLADMNRILEARQADYVALSRPFIREPGLVRSLMTGRQSASRCTSCCYCALSQEVMPLRCHAGIGSSLAYAESEAS